MTLWDTNAVHFLNTEMRSLNTRRCARAITKHWMVYLTGAEGRWKNTYDVWSIIYKEVSELKKQVLKIHTFTLVIFKQRTSLFPAINKQQICEGQCDIVINMISVCLDETQCNFADGSRKGFEVTLVPTYQTARRHIWNYCDLHARNNHMRRLNKLLSGYTISFVRS